jgi:hypothetical protein
MTKPLLDLVAMRLEVVTEDLLVVFLLRPEVQIVDEDPPSESTAIS